MHMIIANALNNLAASRGEKVIVANRINLQTFKPLSEKHGYTVIALEDVEPSKMREALDWFRRNTDWSAFKKKDWLKAWNHVETLA